MRSLILLCPIFFAACDKQIEYIEVSPDVPAELLTPCEISDRVAATYRDLAVLATEHLRSAECANGKIEAVGEIVGGVQATKMVGR
ncbi:Rz1-like lysis system protein LysC [Oceaniglobus trochenteri]|uniref:Rz1-like lysis system protein LysC n=1 Tax=Oceaniglobus trochenteri TaxID=2763260 RepID=UPI001CFFC200|nr:hypothetical protein [Oceaniglobus trochenteri]